MSIKVRISASFGAATKGVTMIEVNGNTVGECLKQLVKRFQPLEKMLFDENDKLARYIVIFVNRESAQTEGLAKPVKDGDEIYPMKMIGGG